MVKTRLNLESEVQEIFKHIDSGKNFLLSGGAGSGKTFSLVQTIQQVIYENPTTKIACITYTNAAVKEIERRVNNVNLRVSTIHEFLWDNIKPYQKEAKLSLVRLINDEKIKILDNETVDENSFSENPIRYKEYLRAAEGVISHDEVLILAHYMFDTYPKLCDVLKDRFKFIFIDEYQDTNELVIDILLKFVEKSNRKNVIGFFGDAMQSIYDNVIGDLQEYVSDGTLQEIKKEQNRRNPRLIYELANEIRNDGIKQHHASGDSSAPNMEGSEVKEGIIKFYYSKEGNKLKSLKDKLKWNSNNGKENKELNLTLKLIASKAEFENLYNIYDDDQIIAYKYAIIKYIRDNKIADDFSESTFGDVVKKLGDNVNRPPKMQKFIDDNLPLFEKAKQYPFEKFRKIYLTKESLLDDKKDDEEDEEKPNSQRDDLIKHLFKIQTNVDLYKKKEYNEFLRKTEFKIKSFSDKKKLKDIITKLQEISDETIEEIIEYADENDICKKGDKLKLFIQDKEYVYNRVKALPFAEFQKLFEYLEGRTSYSTQHKIKGAEFNNVLVILDNGRWNKYNFKYLFEDNRDKESIVDRTRKLFYVCCTRAKEKLAVYYQEPTDAVLIKAKDWFGESNVEEI